MIGKNDGWKNAHLDTTEAASPTREGEWAKIALFEALRDTWSECDPDAASLDTILEQLRDRGFVLASTSLAPAAAEESIKWLVQKARAENDPARREAFIEARIAIERIIRGERNASR